MVALTHPGAPVARGHPQQAALPLFDLFLDLPHPAASKACPPPAMIGAPSLPKEMEQELHSNLSRIGRFAFPEFDDATAQGIPRDVEINRFSQYAMQPKAFQQFTFSMQLQSGVRVHGHVRRYLPMHPGTKLRYDVGRRGERALVVLTRANGGDLVFSAILKTIDAITFQKAALNTDLNPHGEQPEQWFLHRLFDQHRQLCRNFAGLPQQERKPMVLTVDTLEIGSKPIQLLGQVDNSKFLIPTSLLAPTSAAVETVAASPILPLLRVLGVQHTLWLLSAMLSETRILLVSSSPTRLAQCARSALSVLAQGLLNWQHLYIPVLPPHLFQYLAAPYPYLIGMLDTMMPRLEQARSEGLGEMLVVNLDRAQLETRGIHPQEVARRIPDLFRSAMAEPGMPATSMSAPEMLAQDLMDLLKVDKRSLYGESALTNVSETAAKATKAVKTGLLKLKEKGKKFLQNRTGSTVSNSSDDDFDANNGGDTSRDPVGADTLLPDLIFTQGSQNEAAEEEARIAFTSFFLSMFGNMRWYIAVNPGQLPQLDRQRFLQQKRAMGEGENTPIWPLLQNFCQTQMLEQFARARVEEVRTKVPVTSDSPLFTKCADYHRAHGVDFGVVSVRRVARQVAQSNPSRTILLTQARRTAMLLTSNRTYEGDYNRAVSQLVEECRECSSVLFDVMSVLWVRMRDSKGLHWKHGFQALQIMRNLLYHGPLSAIAEATDGLDKIRVMKYYNENMRAQICTQIRQVASQVYNLLVDRSKLFAIRRLCINKRRTLRKPDQVPLSRDNRMRVVTPFGAMHKAFNPRASKVAPLPPDASRTPQFAAEQDLLGFANPPAPAPAAGAYGYGAQTQVHAPSTASAPSSAASDLAGLFTTNVTVSNPPAPAAAAPPPAAANPFAPAPTSAGAAPATTAQAGAAHPPPHGQYPPQPQYSAAPSHPHGQVAPNTAKVAPQGVQPAPGQPYAHQPPAQPQQVPYGANAAAHGTTPTYAAHPQYQQQQYQQQQAYQQQQQQMYQQQQYQGGQGAQMHHQQPVAYAQAPHQQAQAQAPPKPNVSQFDPFK